MKTYNELNLTRILVSNGLDFAHYTYGRGQCSCCYGPYDMPARYWKGGIKPSKYIDGTEVHDKGGRVIGGKPREITYILFKNAYNGSGTVKATDIIRDGTCIGYHVQSMEQLKGICIDLQEQLGSEYIVKMPENFSTCIIIFTKSSQRIE